MYGPFGPVWKNNVEVGYARDGKVTGVACKKLYDLDGVNLRDPSSGEVVGHLDLLEDPQGRSGGRT